MSILFRLQHCGYRNATKPESFLLCERVLNGSFSSLSVAKDLSYLCLRDTPELTYNSLSELSIFHLSHHSTVITNMNTQGVVSFSNAMKPHMPDCPSMECAQKQGLSLIDLPGEVRNKIYQYVMPDIIFGNPTIEIQDCCSAKFVGPGASELDFGQAMDAAALMSTCSTIRQELMSWLFSKVLFKVDNIPLHGPPQPLGLTELAKSLIRVLSFREYDFVARPIIVRNIIAEFPNLEYIKFEKCLWLGDMMMDGSVWDPRSLIALQGIRATLMPTANLFWEPLVDNITIYLLPKGYRNNDLMPLDVDGEVTRITQAMLWRRARGDPDVVEHVDWMLDDNFVPPDFPQELLDRQGPHIKNTWAPVMCHILKLRDYHPNVDQYEDSDIGPAQLEQRRAWQERQQMIRGRDHGV
jgi:hypothetical protein